MTQNVLDASFDQFWAAYPRREAKLDARKAWGTLKPNTETVEKIVSALGWQANQEDWVKDNRRYCPLPASYLRAGRWLDERRSAPRGASPAQMTEQERRRDWTCPHHPPCLKSLYQCYLDVEMAAARAELAAERAAKAERSA